MLRYTVTIVSPGTLEQPRPVLAVPFEPSALVSAFLEELFRRITRQGLELAPDNHHVTLHLDSDTGAIIDSEDLLEDVITDPKSEKLFAVFQSKQDATVEEGAVAPSATTDPAPPPTVGEDQLAIRVVTPELAKNDLSALSVIHISKTATLDKLHELVADHLKFPHNFEKTDLDNECNCTLAKRLADGPSPPSQVIVIHGKSQVAQLDISGAATQASLAGLLRTTFGEGILTDKKVSNYGEVRALSEGLVQYKKTPIVALCDKARHVPAHARVTFNNNTSVSRRVLDLHTSELPIGRAVSASTIAESGLEALALDGGVTIYAVKRARSHSTLSAITGKSTIFRASACWEPPIKQSDRGMAIFLSCLRVFTSIVQDMGDDERKKDAVLHCFDLLTRFPPALRTLYILAQGKTPSAVECAALSGSLFEVLDGFMPTELVGHGHSRVFEGSRLLFGFILEKARSLKLAEDTVDIHTMPYLSAFEAIDLRDHRTNEAVVHAVRTQTGLIEKDLYDAFDSRGVLASSHMQTYMSRIESAPREVRVALMAGGSTSTEAIVFSTFKLAGNYQYADQGVASSAFELTELHELDHLAELCGRNKLSVYMPSSLTSAVAPCLTFDRNAHVAVYTGQLPCSEPGQSSEIFRPQHGSETINEPVLEQILAPLLQVYHNDGSAVLDVLGGSLAVKRLQQPDEILMFCVDTSSSMRLKTDFDEVNDDLPFADEIDQITAESLVKPEHYAKATFDEMKEQLSNHESFSDMVAIVSALAVAQSLPGYWNSSGSLFLARS